MASVTYLWIHFVSAWPAFCSPLTVAFLPSSDMPNILFCKICYFFYLDLEYAFFWSYVSDVFSAFIAQLKCHLTTEDFPGFLSLSYCYF